MEEYKKNIKIIFIICLCLLCIGCTDKNKKTNKFEQEIKKYNDSNIKVELNNVDIVKYVNKEKINKIIKSDTGVIMIGNTNDDITRRAISVLLDSAGNTDLNTIYYINSIDGIEGIDNIENKNIPLVLFVLDGEILDYHIGTLDNKIDLTEDETIELYNIYSEGIHKVLQDACDESC